MICEYTDQCRKCASNASCSEYQFISRVQTYRSEVLIPALTALNGLSLLVGEPMSSEGLDSQL